ncbi:putative ADP-ribosylation factor GTPase-activating protein AGD14 [Vitis vinifera]|uniref:Putative ADP-ribosylation factor GTPase-activating protein AGD14 n=1 Tax=Vitis vinifera TaxID=29760 RepID=A0A438HTZ3_VITVI|nr:putative ADP-ribosylation factor GTPase-activating protein AGD14 [Vitis vinifera]
MANRMKEDEKNEKIIRGLLKLPGNRRCINCNGLGPQYVCTNFWTFVCTTCSGIHREFTHRVKSVSMAKFTSQEVTSLQNGGNERAKEIYLKDWDQQRNSFPDSRLRDFIKHVYEDRRYTGERGSDRPPRVKMVSYVIVPSLSQDKQLKLTDCFLTGMLTGRIPLKQRSASQSPPSEDTYERNYGERSGLGGRNEDRNFRYNYDGRSPGYDQDKQKYGDYKRSPAQFEAGDDRYRDDRSGSRRSEDNKFLGGEPKLEGRSPSYQKELGSSSPPVVRPVRDILGENIPPLRIGEPPKSNGGRAPVGSIQTQSYTMWGWWQSSRKGFLEARLCKLAYYDLKIRTASSSSMGSIDGNPVEFKSANLGSLIDFTSDPEPPNAATATQTQQPAASTVQTFTPPTNSSFGGDNWASFDSPVQEKGSQVASNANTLDSVVSQLSVPAASPAGNMMLQASGTVLNASMESMSKLSIGNVAVATPVNISILPPGGSAAVPAAAPAGNVSSMAVSGGNSFINSNDVQQWPRVQQPQHSLFPINDNQITAQPTNISVGGGSNNQIWSSSLVSNVQGSMSTPTLPSSQSTSKLIQDTSSGEVSKAPLEAKSVGRKALPEDLFTATYTSVPGWQAVPPHGMGFGMQYPIAMRAPTFPQASRSINPFDVNSEAALVQAPMFSETLESYSIACAENNQMVM